MDNRLRLPGPRINFEADVGATGQDHDDFPEPGQARYDHLRMYLIALLCQQSSDQPPTQYREGTTWFDLSTLSVKIYSEGEWQPMAQMIKFAPGTALDLVSLADWAQTVQGAIDAVAPEITFSGIAASDLQSIAVPEVLRGNVKAGSRAMVWVDGLLRDPRSTPIRNDRVELGQTIAFGSRYTVVLKWYPGQNFYEAGTPNA